MLAPAQTNVKLDSGAVNRRIIAKEEVADYRRIEQASVKIPIKLAGPQAKRCFTRYFHTLQLNLHYIAEIGRLKLPHEAVEAIEAQIQSVIVEAHAEIAEALKAAEILANREGITSLATYDTVPMEVTVGVLTALGRRYLEVILLLDELMRQLKTLEVFEAITPTERDKKQAHFKRLASKPAKVTRALSIGLRKRAAEATTLATDAAKNALKGAGVVRSTGESIAPQAPAAASSDVFRPAGAEEDRVIQNAADPETDIQ